MGSPYDLPYLVPDSGGALKYDGVCYQPGEVIQVKRSDWPCFSEMVNDDSKLQACFPECCKGGKPFLNTVIVPPGGAEIAVIPVLEGCRPPRQASFYYCPATCMYAALDAAPVVAGNVEDGTAGQPNPMCLHLTGCEETIHFQNNGDAEVLVTISYCC